MTVSPRRAWSRTGTLIAATATGVIGLGLFATSASAHTPEWGVTCSNVTVDLKWYGQKDNTVTITVDGKDLLPTETFKDKFHTELPLPAHKTEVKVRLVVKAADGDRYSLDETKSAPACEGQTETPTPTPTPTETKTTESPKPSETPSESASTAPSAAPSTPSTDESPAGDLAETGASSSTPLLAGGAAVALLAGGGLLIANRKRRAAARH